VTEAITIDEALWKEVQARGLEEGAHSSPQAGMCAMEAVAYITREPFSDHPQCVCPVIAAFMRSFNDGLPDGERELLIPLLPRVIGTVGSDRLAERRSIMAGDWLIRTHTVAWLRLAGLNENADALASLPEITDMAQVPSIRGPLEAARANASAAWAAAWAAARAAAWDAAGAAARAAAWAAAWAAARAAAWDAAWAAARAAARAAACKKLAGTKAELQQSAILLVERMCALTEENLAS
jgi:hypothetical protein